MKEKKNRQDKIVVYFVPYFVQKPIYKNWLEKSTDRQINNGIQYS